MKLYIAIANEEYTPGRRETSTAYVSRESLIAMGYGAGWTIVEVEVPAPESEAHRVWREKREGALKIAQTYFSSRGAFMSGFGFAYPEPPFADGDSQSITEVKP